jgi:uncharacterized protein YndB with AHSA1/START domain
MGRPARTVGRAFVVDVITEITIPRPVDEVAAYAADPMNAPDWYVNIDSVEWEGEPVLEVGARMAFVARFLNRTLRYTYEITDFVPGERLVMRTAQGPFPMETTYTWQSSPSADGSPATKMQLRNRGEPSGFKRYLTPFIARAIRRANKQDLRRLRSRVESKDR